MDFYTASCIIAVMEKQETSRDSALRGKVILNQPISGYRFSIDAILLSWYASALPGRKLLELGSGCGVCALTFNEMRPGMDITAVELQSELADLARQNVVDNKAKNVEIVEADLHDLKGDQWQSRYDIVISNPPFRAVGRGRLNPDPQKAIARHELKATLDDIMRVARLCLKKQGYLALILLHERLEDIEKAAPAYGFKILQRTDVRPFPDKEANLMLFLLGSPGEKPLANSDLAIWQEVKKYTNDVDNILEGNWNLTRHPLKNR